MAINSVRDLARVLGLSHTTVSDALRNSPRVRETTRARVLKAAEEAGYRYNPLAGALMSKMRRSGVGTFRGLLAIVDLESSSERLAVTRTYHREIIEGAKEMAEQLGFKAELFVLGHEHLSVPRLDSILKSRGIRGVLVLPASHSPDITALEWTHFAGIYTDYIIESPPLDSVCADHFRSMMVALQKLKALGYKRPGLVLHEPHDRRLLYRWEAAFCAYLKHNRDFEETEPLVVFDFTREQFLEWFEKYQPDVVASHRSEIVEWMREAGAQIPETHGYCCLNIHTSLTESAGLNLQPRKLGQRGMASVIAQLHRNEYGIPETPSTITIPALWKDGPTLRQHGPGDRSAGGG